LTRFACLVALVPLSVLIASCGGGGGNSSATAQEHLASVSIVDGNNQTAVVGTQLPLPLVARLMSASGQVLPGTVVNFVVTSGGGSVFGGAETSDGNGLVRERWTVGTTAGPQTLEVRAVDSTGTAVVYATFGATGIAGAAASVAPASGADGQSAQQAQALPSPVTVIVTDHFGNVVPGIGVTFAPCPTCGSAAPPTATTDANGQASTNWTLGVPIGSQTITATVAGVAPAMLSATATKAPPSAPITMLSAGGDGQMVAQHSAIAQPLKVFVADALGNGVPGVLVSFASASGSGYVKPSSANTDANGNASWTGYFHTAGQQQVTASAPSLPSVTFTITVAPSPYPFDGVYICPFTGAATPPGVQPVTVQMMVAGTAVTGEDVNNNADPFSGTLNLADGTLTGYLRYSLDYHYNVAGQLMIDANQRATGSGTYMENGLGGNLWNGTWTCDRQ
jgi:hypothetical protein